MIGTDTSTVSKHLSILKKAGILNDEKQGTMVYYSLEAPCLLRLFGCIESLIEQNLHKQLAYLQSKVPHEPA